MYVLLLQQVFKSDYRPVNIDELPIKEAVLRSNKVQDLVLILDLLTVTPYKEEGTLIERFYQEGSALFDYALPPEGDYFKTETIIDMTTLDQRIDEVVAMAEKKTIAEWENLVNNTIDANELLKTLIANQPEEKKHA